MPSALCRFDALKALQTRPVVSQTISTMKELLVARRGLVKDRVAAANRNHVLRSPLLRPLTDRKLRQVERQIAVIDGGLRALCRADAELKAQLDILVSIPGIGEATALTMLVEMPELGTTTTNASQALPALVAIRFNADMKAKHQALVAAGKPPKVAITAVIRKLAILANALLRELRSWTPKAA